MLNRIIIVLAVATVAVTAMQSALTASPKADRGRQEAPQSVSSADWLSQADLAALRPVEASHSHTPVHAEMAFFDMLEEPIIEARLTLPH